MSKTNKKASNQNKTRKSNRKKNEKYNADNEIIIGVTTKPKEDEIQKRQKKKQQQKRQTIHQAGKKTSKKTGKQTNQYRQKTNSKTSKILKETEIKRVNFRKTLIGMVVLLMFVIGGGIYLTTTPMFNIANIEVEGNEKLSNETCISLTKIELDNTNLFAITKNNIIKNLKENAYVENATITRKLPNTLHISITERKVSYQAEYNKEYVYLDEQGHVLEIGGKKKNVIQLRGLESTSEPLVVGKRVNNEDLKKLDTVLKIVNYCNYNLIKNIITEIDVSNTKNYTVCFSKDGQTAYLGDGSNLSERILNLKTILEKEKGNRGEIFVDGDMSKINGYFRPSGKEEK